MDNGSNIAIRVLVVDDNEVNSLVLMNMLKIFKIQADQTDRGKTAVGLSQKTPYDLIFIDHFMPEMDGPETTKRIRQFSSNSKSIIISLTPKITELLSKLYMQAGADDIYEKPLNLPDLVLILKRWFPQLSDNSWLSKHNANSCYKNSELIQSIIETIDDIDYQTGLKYATQNPTFYIHILEVSLKDLQSCMDIIISSHAKNSVGELRLCIHKLRNIYSNIGAVGLSEESALFEKSTLQEETINYNDRYRNCIHHLVSFFEKLQAAIDKYHASIPIQGIEQGADHDLLASEEYEQCLMKAIYYIRRYEYDSIICELEQLISKVLPEDEYELNQAIRDTLNYDYDKALIRLQRLKNKTGDLPVPELLN